MTEQNKFAYAKTLQNTLSESNIRKLAHGVMAANKAEPETASKFLTQIREKINLSKTNRFQKTVDSAKRLSRLARYAALITKAEGV